MIWKCYLTRVKHNIDTWTLCSQRKVKTLTEIPYYYLFIVKDKDEGDLFFLY